MFETVQTIINGGAYELRDLITRIQTLYALGSLTEQQMNDLIEAARENASTDSSFAPLNDRVTAIETWQREVEERLSKLEAGSSTDSGEPEKPTDEWPEYKQPTGAHDAYYNGDQITWNGQHYRCVAPSGTACTWDPGTYPSYWELVAE